MIGGGSGSSLAGPKGRGSVLLMLVLRLLGTGGAMDEAQRAALADFLRSRRARLRPEDVGLAPGARRRTPGLRREEVAVLSNVGTTWYTWLEQGRDINPSPEILAALARALRLDEPGTDYLFRLAGQVPPRVDADNGVPERLLRLMHAQHPAPAVVFDDALEIVAFNAVAEALYRYSEFAPADRSGVWMFFAAKRFRHETVDWERHARRLLGELREAFARDPKPRIGRTLERLRSDFPEAAAWLDEHEVAHRGAGVELHVRHPEAGELHMEQIVLHSAEAPGLQLVVKLPKAGTDTAQRLERLTADRALASAV
jgi:transcriptional regulator with XRE-family HTH domain